MRFVNVDRTTPMLLPVDSSCLSWAPLPLTGLTYEPMPAKIKTSLTSVPSNWTRREKLRTQAGREIYSKRQQSVEPVFGIIQQAMGFRQILLRGLDKVQNEWQLVCLACNCKGLFNLKNQLEMA